MEDDDFPDSLVEEQKNVLWSHYPMWCALYNKIRKHVMSNDENRADCNNADSADDSFIPIKPVSI